jgi:serine/threonine protein kinase
MISILLLTIYMKRVIVGEGSYGCVHKPSIHCKTPPKADFDYKKYVSKIMKTKNAEQELAEFVTIGNIDPSDEYHLGAPILCKPNLDEANVKDVIKKCKYIKLDDIEANPDNYSLLVLKYGGPDFKLLCNKYLTKYLEKDKAIRIDKFWLEVHHLIKGLKFFKDNGIIHNDIKPQNILFDPTNGKMKYIDFGLMRTKKAVMDSSKDNTNYLGIYHWSYPFDCGVMEKQWFNNYKNRNQHEKDGWKNSLSELIVANAKLNPLNLPINKPESFSILFTYLNPDNTVPNASTQYGYINSFFDGFDQIIKRDKYDTILSNIADSIDIFGLGFTLQFMANCFKRLNALSLEDFTKLSTFFHKMWDFNPLTRVINIDQLLNEYEGILLEIGVLTRLGKSFENNTLVNRPPAPPVIMEEAKIDEKSPPEHLSVALQELADKDPIEISVRCPEGKEFNTITKRCVKKCKEGYERNDKFKCYSVAKKTKKIKSIKPKSAKICPSEQELNPITKRCVKKCPNGYLRNEKFQCYSAKKRIKTVKHPLMSKSTSVRSGTKTRTRR